MEGDAFLIGWLACGPACAYVAVQKNRNTFLWLYLGIAFGPIALLMVGLTSKSIHQPELMRFPSQQSNHGGLPVTFL